MPRKPRQEVRSTPRRQRAPGAERRPGRKGKRKPRSRGDEQDRRWMMLAGLGRGPEAEGTPGRSWEAA